MPTIEERLERVMGDIGAHEQIPEEIGESSSSSSEDDVTDSEVDGSFFKAKQQPQSQNTGSKLPLGGLRYQEDEE